MRERKKVENQKKSRKCVKKITKYKFIKTLENTEKLHLNTVSKN